MSNLSAPPLLHWELADAQQGFLFCSGEEEAGGSLNADGGSSQIHSRVKYHRILGISAAFTRGGERWPHKLGTVGEQALTVAPT